MSWLDKLGASLSQGYSQVSDLFSKQNVGSNQNSEVNKIAQTSFWAGIFGNKNTSTPGFNNNTGLNFTAQKIQLTTDDIKSSLLREAKRADPTQIKSTKLDQNDAPKIDLPAPKAVIIPLNPSKKQAGYDDLSRRVTMAALKQNGINPSNIEMEELMALPGSKNLDMNGWLDKNWKFHDQPGLMPEAGRHKDANGNEVFGYKQTFSPQFQQSVIDDYKMIKGELAATPDKKAVVDMSMNERLIETVKIAYDKGYISKEIKEQLGNLTPEELATTFAVGGAIGIAATSAEASAILGPIGLGAGLAYSVKQMAEFDCIAQGAAKATNRDQLDQPAKEFGAWMGALSKDGVLAMVGAAGAVTAPRVMPRVEQVITTKVAGVKEALAESKVSRLGEPLPATVNNSPINLTKGKTPLEQINEPFEARWEHRINLRKGDGSKSSGMEYAWKRHGGNGTSKKSQFTISREDVENILQSKDVIKSPAVKSSTSGNYIRQVDVGKDVGQVASSKGGQPTSIITIITDEAGNLVNIFPGTLDFKTVLPK